MEQTVEPFLVEFLLEYVFQFERYVSVLTRVFIYFFGLEVAHVALFLSFRSDEFVNVDSFVAEIDFGKVVHVVTQFGLEDVVGDHRVENLASNFNAVVGEYGDVVLDVLSDFKNFLRLVYFLEFVYNF